MNNKDIENKVAKAFSSGTPDVLSSILSSCEGQKGTEIVMKKNKKNTWIKALAATAAVLVLAVGGILGWQYYSDNAVDSTVSLDVNPSVELEVNRKEEIVSAKALNAEGKTVLGDMDLKGTDLDVAVNAIIGSMLKNGYINIDANSILLTVDSKDKAKAEKLQTKLAQEINNILNTDEFSGSVISQTIHSGSQLDKLADDNGISKGKAQLISDIIAKDPYYTFEALASLSVNELNLLMSNIGVQVDNATVIGTPSQSKYITKEEATDIAVVYILDMIKTSVAKAERVRVEFDFDDGKAIYEVEFYIGNDEYDVDIDATSGAVLGYDKDTDRDDEPETKPEVPDVSTDGFIGEEAALNAALKRAGISLDGIKLVKNTLDRDDGKWEYEIEFLANGWEYEVSVDAESGKIVEFDREPDDSPAVQPEVKPENLGQSTSSTVGQEAALNAALSRAGVSRDAIKLLKNELDRDDGRLEYEIEFIAGGYEYEITVNAQTGEIIDFEKEINDR